jgi:hypothetical protein|tara:strand:+ start:3549 stop:3839 length:291 start_codon:yes stop_codon:yes gene_type:complete
LVKLIEVQKNNKYTGKTEGYVLREIYINPKHVVCLREDKAAKKDLNEGLMPDGLDARQEFTKVHLNRGQNGIDVTVVGTPTAIENQLKTTQQLLKG